MSDERYNQPVFSGATVNKLMEASALLAKINELFSQLGHTVFTGEVSRSLWETRAIRKEVRKLTDQLSSVEFSIEEQANYDKDKA